METHGPHMSNGPRTGEKASKGKPMPTPLALSGVRGVTKHPGWEGRKLSKPWQVLFKHKGKPQTFGYFGSAAEAAWERDLQRMELGYEAEGFYNFRLERVQQQQLRRLSRWM